MTQSEPFFFIVPPLQEPTLSYSKLFFTSGAKIAPICLIPRSPSVEATANAILLPGWVATITSANVIETVSLGLTAAEAAEDAEEELVPLRPPTWTGRGRLLLLLLVPTGPRP